MTDTGDEDPIPTYRYLVKELKKAHPTLAYIHVVDPRIDGIAEVDPGNRSNDFIREIWSGTIGHANGNEGADEPRRLTLITAGSFSDMVSEMVDLPYDEITRKGDLMAVGRWFISNVRGSFFPYLICVLNRSVTLKARFATPFEKQDTSHTLRQIKVLYPRESRSQVVHRLSFRSEGEGRKEATQEWKLKGN